jgi:hypothetical protein
MRDDKFVWMASLDDPHTGKRQSFTSLEELYVFLLQQTVEADPEHQSQTGKRKEQDLILIIRTIKE